MMGARITCLLAAYCMSIPAVHAQETAAPLPTEIALPALLRLVAERSPRLAVEQTTIESAEADRVTAGMLPNPSISYGRLRPSGGAPTLFDGSRQEQAAVELPLLIAGQRGARIEAAEQGVLAARARVGLAGNELAWRATELFVSLQSAQEKVTVLGASLGEMDRAAAIISGRLGSGAASRYDLARVEMERASVAARLSEARTDQSDRSAGLAVLLGAPGWRPRAIGQTMLRNLPSEPARWRAAITSGNLQIIAARREEEAALAAVKKVDRERWPVPVVSVGRQWTSDPYGAANFVGLSTEIPFDMRRGTVAKAEAEYRAAQRRRIAVETEADVELTRLLDALAQRRAALERFNNNVGGRLDSLKEMAEDAYRLGRGSVLELIDASRSRLDARLLGIDLRAAAVELELRIFALAGKLGE